VLKVFPIPEFQERLLQHPSSQMSTWGTAVHMAFSNKAKSRVWCPGSRRDGFSHHFAMMKLLITAASKSVGHSNCTESTYLK
jgi:hypothetical protein